MELERLAAAMGVTPSLVGDDRSIGVPAPGAPGGAAGSGDPSGITDVTHDSRKVVSGSLFCCVRGTLHDGHEHAAEAVRRGAVALLCEHPVPVDVPQLVVDDVRVAMSRAAALVWGSPSEKLKVIGVTGTNGKTTVASMITSILRTAGLETRMVGTLTGERTTPESTDLQRLLAGFVDEGVEVVAMEVSSHALVQHRVDDVDFDLAVFTNLGRDHLDFHRSQEAYFAAKSRLFEPGFARLGVVNVDDVHGRLLHDARAIPMKPVSLSEVGDLVQDGEGSRFVWRGRPVRLPMVGRHNVLNAVLAGTSCVEMGVDVDLVVEGLANLEQIPGRFEIVDPPGRASAFEGVTAVVDYAHTADALESILVAARDVVGDQNRVVVVFGCGGDRDVEKRPEMGRVAALLADEVVVTSDNPRSEDPGSIIAAIVAGVDRDESDAEVLIEPDRRMAISAALHRARAGDVVVVAGKGHETGQIIGDRTEPFDDREVVAELLRGGPQR